MAKWIFKISMFLMGMIISHELLSQKIDESDTHAMMQANFLFQFANNSNWPNSMKTGSFKIYVVGNHAVYEHLQLKYGQQYIGKQPIEIMEYSANSNLDNIHVVFIDKSKKADWNTFQKSFKNKSTLLVSNWEGGLTSGSHINFKNVNGSVRYEMDEAAITERQIQAGLKIIQWKVNQ
jgi:hypothetical protein